jgi:hypothetical protein
MDIGFYQEIFYAANAALQKDFLSIAGNAPKKPPTNAGGMVITLGGPGDFL